MCTETYTDNMNKNNLQTKTFTTSMAENATY